MPENKIRNYQRYEKLIKPSNKRRKEINVVQKVYRG